MARTGCAEVVIVYAHLPPNQRDRDVAAARGRAPPKAYASRNSYQLKPIEDICFRIPLNHSGLQIFGTIYINPTRFLLVADAWGLNTAVTLQ